MENWCNCNEYDSLQKWTRVRRITFYWTFHFMCFIQGNTNLGWIPKYRMLTSFQTRGKRMTQILAWSKGDTMVHNIFSLLILFFLAPRFSFLHGGAQECISRDPLTLTTLTTMTTFPDVNCLSPGQCGSTVPCSEDEELHRSQQ